MKLRIFELETEAATQQDCAAIIRAALGVEAVSAALPPPIPSAPLAEAIVEHELEPETPRRLAPAKVPKALPAPATRSAPGGGDTITARILEALKKKPMSSLELCQYLKLEPNQVYAPASAMKSKGQLENKIDENDGTRRWFVK